MTTLTLSEAALYETCRALADRGEDYGWYVYGKGFTIPAAGRRRMISDDDNAQGWLDAFDAALAAFEAGTGEGWRY